MNRKRITQILIASLICLIVLPAGEITAQVDFPVPSPKAKLEQQVGLTDITIEYSRPGVKKRTIFGDLVPYGEMWRTGANASTKVEFSKDVKVNGQDLPKGKYALYTIPGKEEWTIIFHKNLSYWGTGGDDYNMEEDALRFTVTPFPIPVIVETFTIDLNNIRNESATLDLIWEQTYIAIPIQVGTDKEVSTAIDKAMAGPSGRLYYQSARYYFDSGKDLEQALTWIDKSLSMEGEKFWMLRLKSQIQAGLTDYKGAIETAKRSKEVAMEEGNQNYVRMNEKSIAEWSAKL